MSFLEQFMGAGLGVKLIDRELNGLLRPYRLGLLSMGHKTFPKFRFADFHRATKAFLEDKELLGAIDSTHHEDLSNLALPAEQYQKLQRRINSSATRLVDVAYRKEEGFPEDCFRVYRDPAKGVVGVLRIRRMDHTETIIEVGVSKAEELQPTLEALSDLSVKHSVYRNQLISVEFEEDIEDEYSSVQGPKQLNVTFRPEPNVTEDKIVLDEEIAAVLERNVVSFHKNRDRLNSLGIPLQRGVLLHGPPGTGKTYTCQYLYGCLAPVTMIVVSGKGLTEVKSVCNLARMLQPTVVVLEDVDLVFTSREINFYSTGLGDMMDELDGFQKDDAVTFILTTNAIERLEAAVKDRPGRISQCVYFGPPTRELRARYLAQYLKKYDCSKLSMESLADLSEGGSQAFLQELVYRAVQIAVEGISDDAPVELEESHFETAMKEMTSFTQKATEGIIGFQHRRN